MIIHSDIEQRSPEWFALRCGRITGTRIGDMAGGKPPTVELLCKKIAAEILTGQSVEKSFTSDAMQAGIDTEAEARAAYEMETLSRVWEVGFISEGELFGVSPDGLIGDEGMVELKCPLASTHIGYLMAGGKAWRSYRWQIQGQLWVSGRDYVDFVSYCPTFPESKQLLIERVVPDAKDFAVMDERAEQCKARIAEILEAVR